MVREVKFCKLELPCEPSVDCKLSDWESWTACSETCNGVKRRSRRVLQYGRGMGAWCMGGLKETWPCGTKSRECGGGVPVDCVLTEWEPWGECSATCGGGQRTRNRDIKSRMKNGGKRCAGPLMEIGACVRSKCPPGPPHVDCKYDAWSDWAACSHCSGERLRYRHILRYPENGGQACQPAAMEESSKCPRKCHTKLFCAWADWGMWNTCSTTCGTGGRRHRKRHLHLSTSDSAPLLPDWASLAKKYDSLYRQTQELEEFEVKELLLAFGAGMLSLVSALTAVRVLSLVRSRGYRAVGEEVSRSLAYAGFSRASSTYGVSRQLPIRIRAATGWGSRSRSGSQRYLPIEEVAETTLPLVEPERPDSDVEICD